MEDQIYEAITRGVRKPKKNKYALFLCGASGVGKSRGSNQFLSDMKVTTTYVYINIDEIAEKFGNGQRTSGTLLPNLLMRAMKDGYSIYLNGTCRNRSFFIEHIGHLKNAGYTITFGMIYASLNTVIKRVRDRKEQPVPESVVRDIYAHMSKNAETYMKIPDIDQIYLYTNEDTMRMIFHRNKKEVECISPKSSFYFDVSQYC